MNYLIISRKDIEDYAKKQGKPELLDSDLFWGAVKKHLAGENLDAFKDAWIESAFAEGALAVGTGKVRVTEKEERGKITPFPGARVPDSPDRTSDTDRK